MLSGASEPTLSQPLKKIVAITRAAAGGVQHLALYGMGALQVFQPLGGASCALGRAAEVEQKQGDGERDECDTRQPPRPWPCEDAGDQTAAHHRSPFRQSSSRAQTATAIPASARAMNSQRRLSR